MRDWPPCPPIQRDGGWRSRQGANPFISVLTVAHCPAIFPGVWPQLRDTLSTSRSAGRGTGAFIYALSADENSPALAASRHASKALFSYRFKCSCPPRRQRHFHGNADRAYNTLHFAKQSRVPKGGHCPPFWKPPQEKAVRYPSTGRIPPFLVLKHGSPLYCGILFSILKANISNEWYAKDTSKKIRAVMKSKGEAGEHLCTNPPYGYIKDPENKKRWIVDEEAAEVVKRIFALCLDGYGPSQIARILKADKVITPTIHFQQTGRATRNAPPDNPCNWTGDTVADILERPEYQGHTVNFKTYKQSYKSKKTCNNPEEKWLVFENTHEAIIDADTWARVQELRKNKRRPTRTGKTNMFSGIVRCADCGEKLYYCTSRNFEARQDHFVCSTSRLKGKEVCPTHFIRAVVLEQGVLAHMRMTIACVANHEEQFRKAMGAKQKAETKRELAAKRWQLTQAERRIEEIDRLFKRIYEDNVSGKLSDSRFQMLSDDYEQEQEELREKLLRLNEEITKQEEQAENIDRFIGKVRKYLDLDKLAPAILNDMVKAVYVHAPDKSKGYREQQIDISYDLVGILPASLLNDLQNGETA